jgi:phosphopantothenoylcysteine decarboxylase / phosphopantothenate---cysteine ligase
MHSQKQRRGLRFLITAGGTREYIDPVRFISNASSGKMGYELVRAAVAAGHGVTLITASTSMPAPKGVAVVRVETTSEMFKAVKEHLRGCDCLIMAAAVSDYTPLRPSRAKIRRTGKTLMLTLKPTPDILKWAASRKSKGQTIVGFALEGRNLRANAERKMRAKGLDMIIANTPATVGSERCEVLVRRAGDRWQWIAKAPKRQVAGRLIRLIEQLVWAD